MLGYPPALRIKVSDKVFGLPVAQVALIITLFAAKKNNYHIARVTNADGEIRLTNEEVRQSIERDRKLFIMDYSSTLEECSHELEIEICDCEQIRRTTEAMEMYKDVTDIDEGRIDGFQNSVNGRYAVPVTKRIRVQPGFDTVEIKIERVDSALDCESKEEKRERGQVR